MKYYVDELVFVDVFFLKPMGRVVSESIPFELNGTTVKSSTKKYTYDNNSNLIMELASVNKANEATLMSKKVYSYDNKNQLVQVALYHNNQPKIYSQYVYECAKQAWQFQRLQMPQGERLATTPLL